MELARSLCQFKARDHMSQWSPSLIEPEGCYRIQKQKHAIQAVHSQTITCQMDPR